jgi:hypothetical protein
MLALVLTYPTTFAALAAEKRFKGEGRATDLIPVPTGISSDCGFCLLFSDLGEKPVQEIIAELAQDSSFEGAWLETTTLEAGSRRREKRYERIV